MQGQRLPDGAEALRAPRGSYWKTELGTWHCWTPNGLLGNLAGHHVTEHEDGTVTVSPSILVNAGGARSWHGYLARGIWREC